jgi:hypothetical protein
MSKPQDSKSQEHFNKLQQFRQEAYGRFGNARDALFELSDAVIQMPHVQSFVELSTAPAFRRKWSSVYEALRDGRPDRNGLCELYLKYRPTTEGRLLLVIDHTAWPRLWARTLPERSYQHQPSEIPGQAPVTIGQGYSTLGVVPERRGSWALPLLHDRMTDKSPVQAGAAQMKEVSAKLTERPVYLMDAEYACADLLLETQEVKGDKLMRLRSNLVLEGLTRPYLGHGPHPIHGIKFRFKDPSTWWKPDEIREGTDKRFGPYILRIWHGLRFGKALDCRMTLVGIEHPEAPGTRRKPKLVWFAWVGEDPPEEWWLLYNRRFTVDHWYRFAKGRLHWLLPKVLDPQPAECWSYLMSFLTWEAWLARSIVEDQPLPWQKPQSQLTPGRVCQGLQNLLSAIGTPTKMCKPRGVAPGWPTGKLRTHRVPCDLVRSEKNRLKKAHRQPIIDGKKPGPGRPKTKAPPLAA